MSFVTTLRKYLWEFIIGIVIFVGLIFLLPRSDIDIPDIEELSVTGTSVEFVLSDTPAPTGTNVDTVSGSQEDTVQSGNTLVAQQTGTLTSNTGSAVSNTGVSTGINRTALVAMILAQRAQSGSQQTSYASCMTPWGATIQHGASVFAYEQRKDDAYTCNVQRRVCNNGLLGGSYIQSSCVEYGSYDHINTIRQYFIPDSIKQQMTNEFIQPSDSPANPGGSFGTDGQYFRPSTATTQVLPSKNPVPNTSTVQQTTKSYRSCLTPWGATVPNGQFVRAYQFDKGFTNMACEVQLRLCVDGDLEGTFGYESCKAYNIALEDFLDRYFDPEVPSLSQMIDILKGLTQEPYFAQDYPQIDLRRLIDFLRN